ncbi:sugar transferase [Enterococcus gallinarum]|uniref:Sugar transferase n=1 Tax=Enterococcus gallinarum TaxID=1353 RepID=A0AAE7T126_ENTGA|nr:sugar transferase [Enterococcus gallinarum]QOG29177.1 sugar transferase [Enterococcus gallinarum]
MVECNRKSESVRRIKNKKIVYRISKQIFDILFSIVIGITVFPIVFVFCILILIESPGSPIYQQKRVGLKGKEFTLYKLRSMRNNAEINGAQWADKNDKRITGIGKFIRKTRIDELPQLINVFKGEMSFIGPRPERKIFIDEFLKTIPDFNDRLLVKPGLTGWAQVNGGYEITPQEKLELDMYYIENRSFLLDLKIIFKTIKIIFTGEGAR